MSEQKAREFWKRLELDLIQSVNESLDEAEPNDSRAIHITAKGLENAIARTCEVYSEREVLPTDEIEALKKRVDEISVAFKNLESIARDYRLEKDSLKSKNAELAAKLAEYDVVPGTHLNKFGRMSEKDKQINLLSNRVNELEAKLEKLIVLSTNFLARTRENWEYLNPNNFDPNSLIWKCDEELGEYLSELQKLNEHGAGKVVPNALTLETFSKTERNEELIEVCDALENKPNDKVASEESLDEAAMGYQEYFDEDGYAAYKSGECLDPFKAGAKYGEAKAWRDAIEFMNALNKDRSYTASIDCVDLEKEAKRRGIKL